MHPFSATVESSAAQLSESDLIERIREWIGRATPASPEGIGDDCAVQTPSPECKQVITIDPVIYGVHFDDSVTPPDVAAKLLKRNASDVAAMGASPKFAVVSMTLPPPTQLAWLESFYRGLAQAALQLDMKIVGGDIASSGDSHLSAHLCMIGEISLNTPPLQRGGAQDGDIIYVTGELGGSLLRKHYAFEPRIAEGKWLASQGHATACLDISDGIGKDATQLPSKDYLSEIDVSLIPISDDAVTTASSSNRLPEYHAINDGEDYELLFTVAPQMQQAFESDWKQQFETRLTRIGAIRAKPTSSNPSIRFVNATEEIEASGYEHL